MNADQVAVVLRVACLTEDRAPDEQRAMLDLALWADTQRARFTTLTRRQTPQTRSDGPQYPTLTREVEDTYQPEGKPMRLAAPQRETLTRLEAKFDECTTCGVMRGAHPVACLAADIDRWSRRNDPPEGRLL